MKIIQLLRIVDEIKNEKDRILNMIEANTVFMISIEKLHFANTDRFFFSSQVFVILDFQCF